MRKIELLILWTGFLLCTGIMIFASQILIGERPFAIPILRFILSVCLLFLGICMSKQRYWDGYADGCKEINITMAREVEKAIHHLRQENKNLQDTIFDHEAVIIKLEKNAGCYEGDE